MTFDGHFLYNIFLNGEKSPKSLREVRDAYECCYPLCDETVKIPVKVDLAYPEPSSQFNLHLLTSPPTGEGASFVDHASLKL